MALYTDNLLQTSTKSPTWSESFEKVEEAEGLEGGEEPEPENDSISRSVCTK